MMMQMKTYEVYSDVCFFLCHGLIRCDVNDVCLNSRPPLGLPRFAACDRDLAYFLSRSALIRGAKHCTSIRCAYMYEAYEMPWTISVDRLKKRLRRQF